MIFIDFGLLAFFSFILGVGYSSNSDIDPGVKPERLFLFN